MTRGLGVLGWCVLGGCVRPVDAPPAAPGPAQTQLAPVHGALFLQGFDMTWESRPHRLRAVSAHAEGQVSDGGRELVGSLRAEARGGSWASGERSTDTPQLAVMYGGVHSAELAFVRSHVAVALDGGLGRKGVPDKVPQATVDKAVPLPAGAWTTAAVWLTGFHIESGPDHPDGYTPHALAVHLSEPAIVDGEVRFQVSARVEAAPVPDRRQDLSAYTAQVHVDSVVVLARGGDAARVDVDRRIARGVEPLDTVRRQPVRVPVAVDLDPGGGDVIAGLSGFSFALDADGPVAGRYLRALTASIEDHRWDPLRGVWSGVAALRFSNAGDVPRSLAVQAGLSLTALQTPAPVWAAAGRWSPAAEGQEHCAAYPSLTAVPCAETH